MSGSWDWGGERGRGLVEVLIEREESWGDGWWGGGRGQRSTMG